MSKRNGSCGSLLILLLVTLISHINCFDVPALIVFGDSTVDVGNNNYMVTVVKSDFKPYGRDFVDTQATGRFSNGLIIPDFIAQDLGLPFPLAYLDPNAEGEKLLQGVNFASSGSGYILSTSQQLLVRSFDQQLKDFSDYNNKLISMVGAVQAANILKSAVYIVSTGSNDLVNNYYLNPLQRLQFTVPEWLNQMANNAAVFVKAMYDIGARKIFLTSLPAIGCLPASITLFGGGSDACVTGFNDDASTANVLIKNAFLNLGGSLPDARFFFLDTYGPLLDAWQNPSKYGLVEVRDACCGTGKLEVAILCNAASPGTCSDATQYLFWDSFHPSETWYRQFAQKSFQDNVGNV